MTLFSGVTARRDWYHQAMFKLLLLIVGFISQLAFAHGGGLDSNGGHNNRMTGEYHCHREPCLSFRKQTDDATQDAEQGGYSFSTLYNRDDWNHWIDADGCENHENTPHSRDRH